MIKRLKDFSVNKELIPIKEEKKSDHRYNDNMKIDWITPDLTKEIEHYDDKAKLEFYQHNIIIGNKDIGKINNRSTKFYRYISEPFKKGNFEILPSNSDDEFNVKKIQNLMAYEYDNIVAGAYGKAYGDVLIKMTEELKTKGTISLPSPIIFKLVNFGETRTSSEDSYYLFSGNRIINLALQYNIPIKVYVVDLIPSRRDVREFAQKIGATVDPIKFKKLIRKSTGKENIDDLNARERFKIIQSLKSF